ncbi:hypothetical protein ID866_9587 [Astraeus odoratus]|nr:hypothetical protein ID866_9587 [Astraeus odoratus]
MDNGTDRESTPILSLCTKKPSPDTLTRLIRRLRALTLQLLPVEVDVNVINEPTSRIITPRVISAYVEAAGDFYDELPYCLLRAHAEFIWDANHNPADHGENLGRATACEVLARRIVHQSAPDRMIPMMTTRYRYREADGDISVASSALETAIDNNCKIFLSSSESQDDLHRWYKLLRFASYRAFGFWNAIAFITDGILLAAFTLRVAGLYEVGEKADALRFRSFQVLSFVSPFIWMKLVTIFDGYKYVGTMQICIARMLQESGIFFALLSVLGAGFLQGLYALEAADGESEDPTSVINVLVQGLLQSPDYGRFSASPVGLSLFYLWNLVTVVILLNVLISLFASAYSDIVEDVEAQYMAFFAEKTVAMIRAPDSYVYPAPFNLVEIFLVAPFETVVPLQQGTYAKLNRVVMTTVFFIPLCIIAVYEVSSMERPWLVKWLRSGLDEGSTDDPVTRDPYVEGIDAERGLEISKVKFDELVKRFPNTEESSEATILKEIHEVQVKLHALVAKVERLQNSD